MSQPEPNWVHPLHECEKPDCRRLTSAGSRYCCTPCATAAEHAPPYELADRGEDAHPLLRHSDGCDQRDRRRRPEEWPEHPDVSPFGEPERLGDILNRMFGTLPPRQGIIPAAVTADPADRFDRSKLEAVTDAVQANPHPYGVPGRPTGPDAEAEQWAADEERYERDVAAGVYDPDWRDPDEYIWEDR